MPKNPLGRRREANGGPPTTNPAVTPDAAGERPVPPRPTDQGDRKPSLDVAKDILGDDFKGPDDVPIPEELPPGYDRMAEIAKANSARVQAFSGGLPDTWSPVVEDVPEPTPEEPAIVGDPE